MEIDWLIDQMRVIRWFIDWFFQYFYLKWLKKESEAALVWSPYWLVFWRPVDILFMIPMSPGTASGLWKFCHNSSLEFTFGHRLLSLVPWAQCLLVSMTFFTKWLHFLLSIASPYRVQMSLLHQFTRSSVHLLLGLSSSFVFATRPA